MGFFRSTTGCVMCFFTFAMLMFQMVDAHAGITSPPSLTLGKEFTTRCGGQAADIIKKGRFISQQIWKGKASKDCKNRRCQGLFLQDQDLSKVKTFSPGTDIPVTIQFDVPHVGKGKIVLMDMKAEKPFQSQSKNGFIILKDLGPNFGAGKKPGEKQTTSVKIPLEISKECTKPDRCAIAFQWEVTPNETYEICSLISITA